MDKQVGKSLRGFRKKMKLSQSAAAKRMNISQSAYSRMERGETNGWATYLERICHVFHVTPEEICQSINK
ncbi:MAG: helix-turn-helix domain-containing protein [Tannerella sp.]|jgi:transcriptional regulator with XRE-family HTH domain|nr:helix-turn-helix domain-containing protein [Tannerella sp.]